MTDRFATFADLTAASREGHDFRIRVEDRDSPAVIIAPHGGTIEPETARIAKEIAGSDLSYYAFEALQPGAHGDFHITSHLFDEPRALDLIGRAEVAIAIHGRKDDGMLTVWLGGRDAKLRDAIGAALLSAGFEAERNTRLPGVHEANICNRTLTGEGVQLELPLSLRRQLGAEADRMRAFAEAVREELSIYRGGSGCPP